MTRPVLTIALACALGGCTCGQNQQSGAGAADAVSPPATATATATATAAATEAASAPAGVAPTVSLSSGGKLRLPAGAVSANAPNLPVAQVKSAHLFHVGGDTRRLFMVNELDLEGKTCAAKLDEEWKKMQTAHADTDQKKLDERAVRSIEDLQVGGRRVLYSESTRHKLLGQDGERRSAPLATAVMCEGSEYVALIYATDQPMAPGDNKKLLLEVIGSYGK